MVLVTAHEEVDFYFQFMLLTDGLGTNINEEGIAYYNNIINALLEKGLKSFLYGFLIGPSIIHIFKNLNLQVSSLL